MSVQNFIPTVWEARLLAKFHERSVAELITTPPTKVELPLDNKNYWAFKVDDVDAVQVAGGLIDPHVEESGCGLQETTDKYIFAEALKTTNTSLMDNMFSGI